MGDNLSLIILDNCKDLGEKVQKNLNSIRGNDKNYITKIDETRFNDGSAKITIKSSVRDKDLYILSDPENPECTYEMYGHTNYKSPDDHYMDIRRVVSAVSGHTDNYSIFTPFLYSSRQHSANNYESNDCADALRDFVNDRVKKIITYDVHSTGVKHALAGTNTEFQNLFATNYIIKDFLDNEDINLNNMLVIAPDEGATKRAKYYAGVFRSNMGMCYKLRDLTRVVNGKNPILEHIYIGPEVAGKDAIIIDDMIASGGSILDTARLLKEKGADKVYLIATFSLFTEGIQKLKQKYDEKLFSKIYSTNLTYGYKKAENEPWFKAVDCSYQMAEIINSLNTHKSIKSITNIKPELLEEVMVRKLKK